MASIFILTILLCSSTAIAADNYSVFFNGQEIKNQDKLLRTDGEIYIQARLLADKTGAELRWFESIKSLELKKGDNYVKMMVGNPYLEINNSTFKTKNGLIIRNGHTYLPLKRVLEGFNYVITYENDKTDLYAFKPETLVRSINLREEGQKIVIDLNRKTDYRINKMENEHKLLVEIKRGALSGDFIDGISGDRYNLKINRSKEKVYLQLIIESDSAIPFDKKYGVKASGEDLVIRLMPHIKGIRWAENGELELIASGQIQKPEISYLDNPNRMVLDFPSLMLNSFDLDLDNVKWIKDVRVSQFTYDPMVLRVVIELEEERQLGLVDDDYSNTISFQPTGTGAGEIRDLAYSNGTISFKSDKAVKTELFKLENPARVVINLKNVQENENLKKEIVAEDDIVKKIRYGKFNEETIRIVADLREITDYNLKKKEIKDGYKYLIHLNDNNNIINSIKITDKDGYEDVNIDLGNSVEYEVKKFSYPHRIVVDIKGLDLNKNNIKIPEVTGNVKDVRIGNYEQNGLDVVRAVFELDKFYGYEVKSANPANRIKLNVKDEKGIVEKKHSNLIVIDAGHGGFDPGAVGPGGLKEKDVNLDIAQRVYRRLKNDGFEVMLTRDKDKFISLSARVEMAKEKNAGIFLSIHNNASNKSYTQGTETFVATDCSNNDMELAEIVQSRLIKELKLEDRGIRKDNFYVIRNTPMTSILVELAFISNPHEESLLSNDLFKEKAASAISDSLKEYMIKNK